MLGKNDLQKAINTKRYEGVAKNIIFFVGDGMGVPTHTMVRIYEGILLTPELTCGVLQMFILK